MASSSGRGGRDAGRGRGQGAASGNLPAARSMSDRTPEYNTLIDEVIPLAIYGENILTGLRLVAALYQADPAFDARMNQLQNISRSQMASSSGRGGRDAGRGRGQGAASRNLPTARSMPDRTSEYDALIDEVITIAASGNHREKILTALRRVAALYQVDPAFDARMNQLQNMSRSQDEVGKVLVVEFCRRFSQRPQSGLPPPPYDLVVLGWLMDLIYEAHNETNTIEGFHTRLDDLLSAVQPSATLATPVRSGDPGQQPPAHGPGAREHGRDASAGWGRVGVRGRGRGRGAAGRQRGRGRGPE